MNKTNERALTDGQKCPVCGEGALVRGLTPNSYRYRGFERVMEVESFDCPTCGESLLDDVSIAAVEPTLREWRAEIDDLGGGRIIVSGAVAS